MSFFITLPSFPRPSFEDNTPSSFKVRLPNRLSLEGSGWKVGLASITIPNVCFLHYLQKEGVTDTSWLMSIINKTGKPGSNYQLKRAIVTLGDMKDHKHSYSDGVDFFSLMINILQERRYQELGLGYRVEPEEFVPLTIKPLGTDYELYVGAKENRVASHLQIKVDSQLARVMKWVKFKKDGTPDRWLDHHLIPYLEGAKRSDTTELAGNALFQYLPSEKAIALSRQAQWRFVNLNRIFDHATKRYKRTLYVYANVGKSTIVGDQVVSLLREVEYDPRQGQKDHFHFEPIMIQYHDVLSTDMEVIEVQITETDNTLLYLGGGVTTMVLHFKKE